MTEAKRRNPSIELMGLVYAFPWWVNPAKPDSSNSPYASAATEASAAEYVSDWVTGMKTVSCCAMWHSSIGLFYSRLLLNDRGKFTC